MSVRSGMRRCRRCGVAGVGLVAVTALAACGSSGTRAAFSPTPGCDTSATTPRPVAGSPWSPVAADLPPDFRAQVWVATGAGGHVYAEGAGRLVSLDLASGSWSVVSTLPRRRPASTLVAAPDGTLYVLGGPGRPGSSTGAAGDVDAFTPAAAAWRSIAPMPTGRSQAAAAATGDGRIYVFGGDGPTGQGLTTVSMLDPASGVWTDVGRLPTAADDLAATTLTDGRILVVGGAPVAGGGTPAAIFDPAHASASPVASMPVRRQGVGAVRGSDGRVYVVGGRNDAEQVTATVEVFDPASASWSSGPPMSTPRVDPGTARGPDGRVYAVGGDTSPVGGPGCALIGTVEAAPL